MACCFVQDSEALLDFLEHFKRYGAYVGNIDRLYFKLVVLKNHEQLEARKRMEQYVQQTLIPISNDSEDARIKWLTAETTILHLDMFLLKGKGVGADPKLQSHDVSDLTGYLLRCISLCETSRKYTNKVLKTEHDPGNKACMLAAITLVHLAVLTNKQFYVIQAACLLEFILQHADVKETMLMLVPVYRVLGLSSLALRIYKDIGIGRILSESMCPVYFTRISGTMPSADPASELYGAFERALNFYGDALSKLPDYQIMAMSHRNFESAQAMVALEKRLINSLTRRMLVYERKRVARLTGVPLSGTPQDDYNVKASVKSAELCNSRHPFLIGLFKKQWVISNNYVHWLKAVDDVHEAIRSRNQRFADLTVSEATDLLNELACPLDGLDKCEDLLDVERSSAVFALRVVRVYCRLRMKGVVSANDVVPLWKWIEAITEWIYEQGTQYGNYPLLEKNMESQPFPEFESIYKIHTLAEAFQTASILANKAMSFVKVQKAMASEDVRKINASSRELQQKAINQLNVLKASASRWTTKLTSITASDADMLKIARLQGNDLESKAGVAIASLIGETSIKYDVRRMIQSCHSSMEAIQAIKVPEI